MFDLTFSPSLKELFLKPGLSLTQAYDITNNSSTEIVLKTSVEPWQPVGNNGSVSYNNLISDSNINFSLNNSDLKLGQSFILKPNEKRQLVLKIASNNQVSPSDFYYTFFVSQDTTNSLSQGNSAVNAKIGSHILLTVSSDSQFKKQAVIRNFTTSPKFKDIFFNQINFNAEIENKTDHFFKTPGKIIITKNNKVVKELDLFPTNVLANHSRKIMCVIPSEVEGSSEACILKPPFWPGNYTARLELDPSLNTKPITISFYIFPYSIFSILLSISLILIFWKIKKK